jgi:hypothetical protein
MSDPSRRLRRYSYICHYPSVTATSDIRDVVAPPSGHQASIISQVYILYRGLRGSRKVSQVVTGMLCLLPSYYY